MLLRSQVLISIGNYNLYSHINFLDSFEEFEVEIINNELFKSASYFDIPSNIWVLRGLRKAVKKDRTYANPQYLKIKGII